MTSEHTDADPVRPGDSPNETPDRGHRSVGGEHADPAQVDGPIVRRRRRLVLFAVVAMLTLAIDVVSKVLIVRHFRDGNYEPVKVAGGAVYLTLARNSGAAFSLGTGFTIVLTVVALAVVAFIVRVAGRMSSIGWAFALGLILGGALGNLGDRLFRAPGVGRGKVVDWISLFSDYDKYWPIFNLADSAIVCGAILAGILALRGIDVDGRRPRRSS